MSARAEVQPGGWAGRMLHGYARSHAASFGLVLLALICIVALAAPWVTAQNPYDMAEFSIQDSRLPPGSESSIGSYTYWLGTDNQGRDMVSAIAWGIRTSLFVGVTATLLAGLIGFVIGVLAGFRGGWLDTALMRIVDLQLSIPSLLVALMILTMLGRSVGNVVLAIAIVEWAFYARTIRGSARAERGREYVEAARNLALPGWRIAFCHILPNCMSPILVIAALQCARAITLEATLSFLGLGVPISEPSLGLLVADGYSYLYSGQYWISFYPGLALLIIVMAINLVGDRLSVLLNPRGDA